MNTFSTLSLLLNLHLYREEEKTTTRLNLHLSLSYLRSMRTAALSSMSVVRT